mgnify:CR=1 FL=1
MATNNAVNTNLAGQTGSGQFVGDTSPALTTPNIGTPSAGTLTNCTGLPVATGISGLGANVATWLATPSSANLAAAVTDETGSGALVFATSPTLVTPNIGTPSAGTLTNCTGLPVAGGGTGNSTFTAYSVICAGTTATGAFQNVSGVGTSGQVLTSNGAGALPSWQAAGGGGGGVPVGTMIDYAGTSAPTDYLQCDGSAISRTTYATLFAAIGTTWGVGDGSTTFNIPDFRRRTAVGSGGTGTGTLGNSVGNTGGNETETLSTAQLATHLHAYGGLQAQGFTSGNSIVATSGSVTDTQNTGSGSAHNNLQPSAVVFKCIKYQ